MYDGYFAAGFNFNTATVSACSKI